MTRAELNAAWHAFNIVNADTDKAIEAMNEVRYAYRDGEVTDAAFEEAHRTYKAAMARYEVAYAAAQDLPHVASDDYEDDQLTLLDISY
jgi:hypothetical protein